MKGSGLTGGRRRAALAVVSGSCLALTACAAASSGDTPGQQQAAIPAATLKFCKQIATAMKSLDTPSVTQEMTLQRAHGLIDQLMLRGIASFTTLEMQAPQNMRGTVAGVITDFKAYRKSADKTTSVQQILATVSKGTPAQQPSYEKLLSFTSQNC
jgi:hypothetical protein